MKTLFILKLGSTWPWTARRLGDFDLWTTKALGRRTISLEVVDVERGEALPVHERCAGVIMTGSHAMVTDNLPWSVNLEYWLRDAVVQPIPIFGVCYGHQLLARATGGHVDYHPQGREIGTVEIHLRPDSEPDPLFAGLSSPFLAHTTHAQSVLGLPPNAVHLAANSFEMNHAFRLGDRAWGVQFHPEFNAEIMREYISGLAGQLEAAGRDVAAISHRVTDAPVATEILRRFGALVAANVSDAAE